MFSCLLSGQLGGVPVGEKRGILRAYTSHTSAILPQPNQTIGGGEWCCCQFKIQFIIHVKLKSQESIQFKSFKKYNVLKISQEKGVDLKFSA
jgi:hypothetical protein